MLSTQHSPSDVSRATVVVVCFHMKGCPACADYLPRFTKIAEAYADKLPIMVAEVNDPKWQTLADRLNVTALPATFALRKPQGVLKLEGDVPDGQVHWLLGTAAAVNGR